MDIGTRIATLRKNKDLTLTELGQIVGVGASTVRKWETGFIENMKSDKIEKLAAALDTTPAYIMGWIEETKAEEVIPENKPKLRSVARLQDADISAAEDKQIADYIDFLISKRYTDR